MYDVSEVPKARRFLSLRGSLFAALLLAACSDSEEVDLDEALASTSSAELLDSGLTSDAGTDLGNVDGGSEDGGSPADGGLDGGTPEDPSQPFIEAVIANGTGCPAG